MSANGQAVVYCTLCWVNFKLRTPAEISIDEDPMCKACARREEYSEEAISSAPRVNRPVTAPVAIVDANKGVESEKVMAKVNGSAPAMKQCQSAPCTNLFPAGEGVSIDRYCSKKCSGRQYFRDRYGKNGSAPPATQSPKKAAVKKTRRRAVPACNGDGTHHAAPKAKVVANNEAVMVMVPLARLDEWWTNLAPAQKAEVWSQAELQ